MAKRGRPKKYTEDKLSEIKDKLEKYIKSTKIPIIAEFAYLNDIPRDALYKNDELKYTIKRLIDKKEAQLERLALYRKINHGMAIFSLKQLGWKDKVEEPTNNIPFDDDFNSWSDDKLREYVEN